MARRRPLITVLLAGSLSVLGPVVTSVAADNATRTAVADSLQRASRQQAKLQMHPQIAAPGTGLQSAESARSAMTATFKPKRKGRPVKLQRQAGPPLGDGRQGPPERQGSGRFTAPYARNGRWRPTACRRPATGVSSRSQHRRVHLLAGCRRLHRRLHGTRSTPPNGPTREQDYRRQSKRKCSKSVPDATSVSGGRGQAEGDQRPRPRAGNNPIDVLTAPRSAPTTGRSTSGASTATSAPRATTPSPTATPLPASSSSLAGASTGRSG